MSLKLLLKSLLHRKLVVILLLAQLAISLALIVNSSLLSMHARELLNRPTGLDLENTLMVELKPTSVALGQEPALSHLLERQLGALRKINGVVAAAYAKQAPLKDGGNNATVRDYDQPELISVDPVPTTVASVDIIKALNLKVIEGELPDALDPILDFTSLDLSKFDIRTRRIIITESLAKRLYGSQSAIGHHTNHGRIVAVVSDFTGQLSSDNDSYNLFTIEQMDSGAVRYVLLVRTQPAMADIVKPLLADKLREADSNIDVFSVKSLGEQRDQLYNRESGLALLLTILSGLMLVVAMVSAYSNAFFHALKQQQEIGIKRALGASKGLILRELFSEAALLTAMGCSIGIIATVGLNQLLAQVITTPAVPFWLPAITVAMLMVCVILATWYPAKMATQVSPVTATKSL